MRDEAVARSYAETLFALAHRHEGVEAYQEAMGVVARLLDENPGFRRFLETPRIDAPAKKEVLRKAFSSEVPPAFLNFLLVIVDKRRQRLLRDIARELDALVDEHLGRTHLELTVARPLDDGTVDRIAGVFSELLGKTAIPHVRVDPGVLGGIVARTGDTIYDGSLRRRMGELRRRLMEAELPEPADTVPGPAD